jgi:hypothetical protein
MENQTELLSLLAANPGLMLSLQQLQQMQQMQQMQQLQYSSSSAAFPATPPTTAGLRRSSRERSPPTHYTPVDGYQLSTSGRGAAPTGIPAAEKPPTARAPKPRASSAATQSNTHSASRPRAKSVTPAATPQAGTAAASGTPPNAAAAPKRKRTPTTASGAGVLRGAPPVADTPLSGSASKESLSDQVNKVAAALVQNQDPGEVAERDRIANTPQPGKKAFNWIKEDPNKVMRLSLLQLAVTHKLWEILSQSKDKHTGLITVKFAVNKDRIKAIASAFRTEYPESGVKLSDVALGAKIESELDSFETTMKNELAKSGPGDMPESGDENDEHACEEGIRASIIDAGGEYSRTCSLLSQLRSTYHSMKGDKKDSKRKAEQALEAAGSVAIAASVKRMMKSQAVAPLADPLCNVDGDTCSEDDDAPATSAKKKPKKKKTGPASKKALAKAEGEEEKQQLMHILETAQAAQVRLETNMAERDRRNQEQDRQDRIQLEERRIAFEERRLAQEEKKTRQEANIAAQNLATAKIFEALMAKLGQ